MCLFFSKKKVFFSFIFISLFIILLSPKFVFALEINYPTVPGAQAPQDFLKSATPEQIPALYVKYIFNLVLWASGIIVLGVLIWAGLRFLTAAGRPEAIADAKQLISGALLGVLILLSAFIILNIINPQLTVLSVPKTESPQVIQEPEVPPPPMEATSTSIDTQLLLGRVINEYLFSATRTAAIKDNANKTSQIANTIKKQVDDLRSEVDKCDCGQADPNCGSSCSSYCTQSCTCDVCDNERSKINDLEEKNLERLDDLKVEQNRSIEQLKLIKIDLGKLGLLKYLMSQCPASYLNSLADFFTKEVQFKDEGWPLREVKVWNMINIIYYNEALKQRVYDWATFYCPVSGIQAPTPAAAPPVEPPTTGNPGEVLSLACKSEVPVGETIDRSERIAGRIINRLETLILLDRQMTQQVNEMHVLVSKCSSQQPMCCALCIRIKGVCIIQRCIGQACPFSDIHNKNDDITKTQKMIQQTVSDPSEQNMGIIPIIDNVIPKLLDDLDNIIRKHMSTCVSETPEAETGYLVSCDNSLGGISPYKLCCDNTQIKEFDDCLAACYLKQGEQQYKTCLNDCLSSKTEPAKWCNHYLNFYCCYPQTEQ